MLLSTFFLLFRTLKYLSVFILLVLLLSFCLEDINQMVAERKKAIMDLNDRLANASKPTLPDLPNLMVWFNKEEGVYEVVQNFALPQHGTVMTVEHPKSVQLSLKLHLSENLQWKIPLYDHDTKDSQLLMENKDGKSLIIPGKKLVVNIAFNKAIKVSTFLLKLSDEATGRPTHFSCKTGDIWTNYSIPQEISLVEIPVLDVKTMLEVSSVKCEISSLNNSAEYLTLKRLGIYGPVN